MQKMAGGSAGPHVLCHVPQNGLIIAEARAMSKMSDEPHRPAGVSVHASQEMRALRQVFLESLNHFIKDVRRFSHEWQTRWTDPKKTQPLAEIGEALLTTLAGLEEEFSQPEGPSRPRVATLLNTLLGTPNTTGLLPRLQTLADSHATPPTLDDQRLQSEVDTLFIQLNGLRAEWRDYLALTTPSGRESAHSDAESPLPPLPPNPRVRPATDVLPPLSSASDRPPGGMSDLLRALLPILLVAVVILVLVGGLVSRLPKSQGHGAPIVPLTAAAQPTRTILAGTPTPPATRPPSPPRLSVTPSTLLLPCPGTGAATLQLANTGGSPLDWQASIISTSGSAPGILLDGENTESGHLTPGAVTQISVTAQVTGAQGSLSITSTGESAPVEVPYSLNC